MGFLSCCLQGAKNMTRLSSLSLRESSKLSAVSWRTFSPPAISHSLLGAGGSGFLQQPQCSVTAWLNAERSQAPSLPYSLDPPICPSPRGIKSEETHFSSAAAGLSPDMLLMNSTKAFFWKSIENRTVTQKFDVSKREAGYLLQLDSSISLAHRSSAGVRLWVLGVAEVLEGGEAIHAELLAAHFLYRTVHRRQCDLYTSTGLYPY